jgi:hypothetical protein
MVYTNGAVLVDIGEVMEKVLCAGEGTPGTGRTIWLGNPLMRLTRGGEVTVKVLVEGDGDPAREPARGVAARVNVLCAGEGRNRSVVGLGVAEEEGMVMGGGGNWDRHRDPSVIPVA